MKTTIGKLVHSAVAVGGLCLVMGYTPLAEAAQGCGQGYHRTGFNRCVLNHPGRWATPAPFHRGCWRNYNGQLRCYRR